MMMASSLISSIAYYYSPLSISSSVPCWSLKPLSSQVRSMRTRSTSSGKRIDLVLHAAKLPTGVDTPKEEPKLPVAFWGFTENAEIWNSRAAMIGIIGFFMLELLINRGVLQLIGLEVGKGLNLPL